MFPVLQPQVPHLADEDVVGLEQEWQLVARAPKWQVSLSKCSLLSK